MVFGTIKLKSGNWLCLKNKVWDFVAFQKHSQESADPGACGRDPACEAQLCPEYLDTFGSFSTLDLEL